MLNGGTILCDGGTKTLNALEFVDDHMTKIDIPGQFTLGTDPAVNAAGTSYHYTVFGKEVS